MTDFTTRLRTSDDLCNEALDYADRAAEKLDRAAVEIERLIALVDVYEVNALRYQWRRDDASGADLHLRGEALDQAADAALSGSERGDAMWDFDREWAKKLEGSKHD